jgi:hypothetical protein
MVSSFSPSQGVVGQDTDRARSERQMKQQFSKGLSVNIKFLGFYLLY